MDDDKRKTLWFKAAARQLLDAGLPLPMPLEAAVADKPVPLSIGAGRSWRLWATENGYTKPQTKLLISAIHSLTGSRHYLAAMTQPGAQRHGPDGVVVAAVNDEHRAYAATQLAEWKAMTKAAKAAKSHTAGRASAPEDHQKPASVVGGAAKAIDPVSSTDPSEIGLKPASEPASPKQPAVEVVLKPKPRPLARQVAASSGLWPPEVPRPAPISAPKSAAASPLPQPSNAIVGHAVSVVVRRRNTARLIGVWSAKGLTAAIKAEELAVVRDVAVELQREGFGFPPAAERLVEERYADLVVEHRRRA
jgi:sRNA-binding protein